MKKIKQIAEEIIFITILFIGILFSMALLANASDEVPTEVPPCPEEYNGGLIPKIEINKTIYK